MNIDSYMAQEKSLKDLQKQISTGRARLQFLQYAEENARAEVRQQLALVTSLQQKIDALASQQAKAWEALGVTAAATAVVGSAASPAPTPR